METHRDDVRREIKRLRVVSALSIAVAAFSLMLVTMRFVTGTLWFGIGYHGAWDWVQTYVVGLSTTGLRGYNPAIVQIHQAGPALWVGSQQAIEGGALYLIITVFVLAIALLYASRTRKLPPWKAYLASTGTPVSAPA